MVMRGVLLQLGLPIHQGLEDHVHCLGRGVVPPQKGVHDHPQARMRAPCHCQRFQQGDSIWCYQV